MNGPRFFGLFYTHGNNTVTLTCDLSPLVLIFAGRLHGCYSHKHFYILLVAYLTSTCLPATATAGIFLFLLPDYNEDFSNLLIRIALNFI